MPPKSIKASQRPQPIGGGTAGRRLNPDQRRAQILEVVADLFARRSYPDIAVNDVAEAAGITPGLVYHYFETRTGLLVAAVEASCGALLKATLPDGELSVPVQFEQGVRGYLDYVDAHRMAYLNLFRGPAAQEPAFQPIIEQTRLAIVEHIIYVLGLSEDEVPVTRLALRGYLGYSEAAILHWLEQGGVAREVLERIIFSVVLTVLSVGLSSEQVPPLSPARLREFENAYRAHFRL